MKLLTKLMLCSATALFSGCDCFEYHPYSASLDGNHDINTENKRKIEQANIKIPFKFVFITDTQGALTETEKALEFIKQRGDIDFIIHGGDITDFGLPKEYIWARDLFDECGIPYIVVIGNHDCMGNGNDTFSYVFGPTNFSLNVADTHIVCLNTVALEYDYSKPVPDLDFIENDSRRVETLNQSTHGKIKRTIVAMHSQPFDEQFNNNVAKPFNSYISRYPGMAPDDNGDVHGFCINGHNHSLDVSDLFGNGILYYQCPNIEKRAFFLFTVTETGYDCETIEF